MNIAKNGWTLRTKTGEPVVIGASFDTHHGNPLAVLGGTPPHKEGSTGRVHGDGWEYYPSVFNLVWTKD